MEVNLSVWEKLTRLVSILLILAALVGIVLWYTPVIKQNERMRKDNLELEKKIEKEMETARRLDTTAKSLQDSRTVERLARERLNYARPGETVIHFEAPRATNGLVTGKP